MRRFSFTIGTGVALGLLVAWAPLAHADTLGQVTTFHVSPAYDAQGASSVTATLRAISPHGYLYVDDRAWAGLSAAQRQQFSASLNQLNDQFDAVIYPRSVAFWGSESNPGVDGDPHVTLLMEQVVPGNGGYFQTINSYTRTQAPESNQREMLYVSADSITTGRAQEFVAHEFQHLISFNQKELLHGISDDVWLNESRSEYNITVDGYNEPFTGSSLQRRMQSFVRNPSDSLVDWPNTSTDYAIAAVFIQYVADRFNPAIIAATIHAPNGGVAAVESGLSQTGHAEHFSDIFTDWMVASYINDPTDNTNYGYTRPGMTTLHVPPQQTATLSTNASTTSVVLREWQPMWIELDVPPSQALPPVAAIQFNGQAGPWWGGASIAVYNDGHHRVVPFSAQNGQTVLNIPTQDNGARLASLVLAVTQGTSVPVGERQVQAASLSVTASLGEPIAPPPTSSSPTPQPLPPVSTALHDGDLVRRSFGNEVYVIWGKYRRYLLNNVLRLYGFENRPVTPVDDTTFGTYTTSNYIRAIDGTKVYAVWPDGTKHWLNITPQQWDTSGRDWNAIFIVNDAEVNFYTTGPDITR